MDHIELLDANKSQEIFDSILAKRGLEPGMLTAAKTWGAFTEFAALPIDLVVKAGSDLIMYEYGMYSFAGPRMLNFSWSRFFYPNR